MPLTPGNTLHERYRIESILGQGGMGAVYRAIDINLGVPVAVKENLFTTEEYARQFWREATILAGVRHPHLPRVTDHFVVEGEGQYLVMDFILGEDLRQMLERGGPIPEQRLLPWFLQICDALAYLHSRRPAIVHRDVKPGNIKITPDGRALLVDFGLAKVVEDSGSTTVGAKAMTPGFSPPEQYGMGRTDPRSDVYSLGATLYAALTVAIPEDAVERMLGRTKLTPIQKRNPRVTTSMAQAVEKALEVKPEERYQSVSAFAAALAAASGSTQPAVSPNYPHLERTVQAPTRPLAAGADELAPLEVRHRRWPYFVVGGVALVLVVIGSILALGDGRAASPPPQATAPGDPLNPGVVAGTPAAFPTQSGFLPTPVPAEATGPAAALLATPIGGGIGEIAFASARNGLPQLFLMNADGTDVRQLTDMDDGACQPAWSPDGSRLLLTSPCRGEPGVLPGVWGGHPESGRPHHAGTADDRRRRRLRCRLVAGWAAGSVHFPAGEGSPARVRDEPRWNESDQPQRPAGVRGPARLVSPWFPAGDLFQPRGQCAPVPDSPGWRRSRAVLLGRQRWRYVPGLVARWPERRV